MKLKWNGRYSEDGRYMIQESSVYIGPGIPRARDVIPHFSATGEPPYTNIGEVFSTIREAKGACQKHAERLETGA